jgi:hypothetical protein
MRDAASLGFTVGDLVKQGHAVGLRPQAQLPSILVRANALEDNVVLYKTINGVRSALDIVGRKGGYGVAIPVPANSWHSLRIDFKGTRFRASYNGTQLFEVEDSTFT